MGKITNMTINVNGLSQVYTSQCVPTMPDGCSMVGAVASNYPDGLVGRKEKHGVLMVLKMLKTIGKYQLTREGQS